MKLSQLISNLEVVRRDAETSIEIGGLAYDSRSVREDDLFFAVPGFKTDGHDFISSAAGAGAAAAVTQNWRRDAAIPQIQVPDVRRAMAAVAFNFYANPASKLKTIGVTGTNGKTTTTFLIDSILSAAGIEAALIGGVLYRVGDHVEDAIRTTPEAIDLQLLLAQAAGEGAEAAIMEVSSHGIDLARVDCLEFDIAVFTNLTRDHLDLHGEMGDYFQVKRRLFKRADDGGCAAVDVVLADPVAVLNIDDPYGRRLAEELREPVTYGLADDAMVRAELINYSGWQTGISLVTPAGEVAVELKLPGEFNVYNALAAVSAAYAMRIPLADIVTGINSFHGAPGRFERIATNAGFQIILDYAHNEDGLESVLKAARKIGKGRLITVFGCPGERDREKRPGMGRIAGTLSDLAVLTTDDCYGEPPKAIMDAVERGLREAGGEYRLIEDRRNAIEFALATASAEDTILVAGKGHERVQIMKDGPHPFSDRDVIEEFLHSG